VFGYQRAIIWYKKAIEKKEKRNGKANNPSSRGRTTGKSVQANMVKSSPISGSSRKGTVRGSWGDYHDRDPYSS